MNLPLITLGKTSSKIVQRLNLGNGSTWPGHIALKMNKNFIKDIISESHTKVIIVAGTNGKTTTSSLIADVLTENKKTVLRNESGANLLNGIASTILLNTNSRGKLTQEYAVFEVDENALSLLLQQITPDYLVLLNLFRDQLDRYGEINTIVSKWQDAIDALPAATKLVLNADDPQIAYLGNKKTKTSYFGVKEKTTNKENVQQAADSVSCPQCDAPLIFDHKTFSHLGIWHCKKCGLKSPQADVTNASFYPLTGVYNQYNTHAAILVLKQFGFSEKQIIDGLKEFKPAFGRQETLRYKNKNVQLFLSKNPTSFNQSFETIRELEARNLLIVLNDRVPDGHDISWIWDVDLKGIEQFKKILISGDRVYDMALRFKYEGYKNVETFRNLALAVDTGVEMTHANETFFVLPTYSAMLEVRKILTGKKIL